MTVNHDQIQLSLDPLFLLSLPSSSFFRVGNKQPHTEAFRILARRVFCVSQFWGTAA